MDALRIECDRQGRDIAELEITGYWNHSREGLEGAQAYLDAGVTRLLVNPMALRMGGHMDAARQFAAEVLPQVP